MFVAHIILTPHKKGVLMDEMHTNCRFCGTRIWLDAPFCPQCGGPNEPEAAPWYSAFGSRIQAALKAKTESVWADRLASLMPLQFLVSAVTLFISLNTPKTTLVMIISIIAMATVLVYYPGWYKNPPEKRKEFGLIHFLITIVQLVIVYLTLMS
ncbi:hypothetical protein A3A84_00285 [Candidatus Collierbacteria bacterium RIFCSPLOWO2_01_FULL_50_23]|nr:MAG: hypothetical protein A3A84_00285 [Candidatus Collierbacteria bacterium RIFCSPLOWO2_01_FULL_50_23]